jgi:hypothetical protein
MFKARKDNGYSPDRWNCANCAESDFECKSGDSCVLRATIIEQCLSDNKATGLHDTLRQLGMRIKLHSADYWEVAVS